MTANRATKSPASFSSVLVTQAIAIVGFVIIPAGVTMIVPRATIVLRQFDDHVEAEVTRFCLLVIPYHRVHVGRLTEVESHVRAAEHKVHRTAEERRKGKAEYRAGDGSIILEGPGVTTQVQSTPEQAPQLAEQIRQFLAEPTPEGLVLTAAAEWWFTYLLGGAMAALTGLYLLGSLLAILRRVLLRLKPL
ncbi:MAG: hypothetical protein JSS02_07755 [Planctomycetes bacterium]|nr:hypothetical protein [Planctomycetota bacterium]